MATTNIYYRGDFKTIVTLANDFTLLPFKFIYTSGKLGIKQYVASYDGTNFTNCRLSDDGKKIVVVFDNHNLAPGPLKVVRVWRATDDDMPDGYFDTQFGADTGILLTTNPADCTPEAEYYERIVVESEELAQIMRGNSAYEVAVKNGYVGTETQWVASLSAPATTAAASCNATENAVKAAEANRASAETNRVSAEATRVSNESARQSAETNRASAEANRASAETNRASAEANRASAEANRATAESTRTSKETARQSAETARATAESGRATAETARANAETTRQANEETRVSAETSRASAESARAATFTTNEATRQTTFNNSEAGRTITFNTNEAARQSAASEQRAAETATFNSKEAQRDAAVAAATAVATDVDALERDFGQYAELPSVTLTTEQTGKYIYENGEFRTAPNWAIAEMGEVVVGNTYELYMESSAKMVKGVALFVAREVTTTASGQTKTEYIPLFSAKSTDIPSSGYVCFEAMEAYSDVLVCYRTDVSGADNILVRRYGTKASIATQINNLKKKVDLKSFADGYYQGMRVGTADNLTARGTATSEEFALRVAGGSNSIEDGDAEIKSIKGNTLVFNQLFDNTTIRNINGNIIEKVDGEISTTKSNIYFCTKKSTLTEAHKYLLILNCKDSSVASLNIYANISFTKGLKTISYPTIGAYMLVEYFFTAPSGCDYLMMGYGSTASHTMTIKDDLQLFDLTQMFGAGNEPSSVAEFRKLFPKAYYPYSEPKLLDMKASGVKTSGRNLWDEVWESGWIDSNGANTVGATSIRSKSYINVDGNKKYYILKPNNIGIRLNFYDANKAHIEQSSVIATSSSGGEITTPSNCCFMRFCINQSSYKNDICINLSDASFNGTYEPYETHTRSWSSTMAQHFPNGMKSAGTAYDEITSTKVYKRIGSVDLGTLSWSKSTSSEYFTAKYKNYAFSTQNTIMVGYTKVPAITNVSNINMSYSCNGAAGNYIAIRNDNYTTAADLKATLNGVILYYQLLTAEESEIDELNLTERVAKGGMEEAIVAEDTESSPLKIDVVYPIDALGTILSNKAAIADLITRVTALENK